jgi:hypothetical protein
MYLDTMLRYVHSGASWFRRRRRADSKNRRRQIRLRQKMVVSTVHACLHMLVSAEKARNIYYNAAQETVL